MSRQFCFRPGLVPRTLLAVSTRHSLLPISIHSFCPRVVAAVIAVNPLSLGRPDVSSRLSCR